MEITDRGVGGASHSDFQKDIFQYANSNKHVKMDDRRGKRKHSKKTNTAKCYEG